MKRRGMSEGMRLGVSVANENRVDERMTSTVRGLLFVTERHDVLGCSSRCRQVPAAVEAGWLACKNMMT